MKTESYSNSHMIQQEVCVVLLGAFTAIVYTQYLEGF